MCMTGDRYRLSDFAFAVPVVASGPMTMSRWHYVVCREPLLRPTVGSPKRG